MRALTGAAATAGLTVLVAGCALHSDVTRVERQLLAAQQERARSDSATAANMAAIARLVQGLYDSQAVQHELLTRLRGDVRVELFNVQQQLVAIQELSGQSQQRLTELRGQLDRRFQQPAAPAAVPGNPGVAPGAAEMPATPGAATPTPAATDPGADQILELSLQQLRRGSPATARLGFAEFLRRFPDHPRAVDAEFFTGEAWAAEQRSDSAAAAYRRVVQRFPAMPRAATAMYKLGLLEAAAGHTAEARTWFNRVVTSFPSSDEAAAARDQLRSLPTGPARGTTPAPGRRPPAR